MSAPNGRRDSDDRRRKGSYAVGEDTAGRRPAWLIPLLALLALILIGLLLFFLLRDRDSGDSTAGATSPATAAVTAAPTTATGSAAATPSATAASSGTAGGGDTSADGQVLAGSQVVVPLPTGSGDLSRYVGQAATARTVEVESVPADEGFWVGASATDRVWVQLTGAAGESAVTVKAGDRISFSGGKVVATPSGYAQKVGVEAAGGAAQLAAEKAHIEIAKNAITLIP